MKTNSIVLTIEQAIDRMLQEAAELGANAVISVRFATSTLMGGAAELLAYGIAEEVTQLDEKFYLELFHPKGRAPKKKARTGR